MKTYAKKITKHKAVECTCFRGKEASIFNRFVGFRRRKKTDHAGFDFWFQIKNFVAFEFSFYDVRHWNHTEDRWYKPSEEYQDYLLDPDRDIGMKKRNFEGYFRRMGWDKSFETVYGIKLDDFLNDPKTRMEDLCDVYVTVFTRNRGGFHVSKMEGDA